MIAKSIVFLCFCCYGAISVYDVVSTYYNFGAFNKDEDCVEVFYVNLFNCILGALLSLYVVTFLVCKCLFDGILDLKLNLSITKAFAFLTFVGLNIWNCIQLSESDECYLRYKIKNYNLAFISLVSIVFITLLINALFCSKEKKTNEYKNMDSN